MIITLKELLDARSLQFSLMLDHSLGIGILPVTVSVFGVEVILMPRWYEWRLHALLVQILPVEALEPAMLLEHLGAFLTETITWFSLQKLVNKVSSFQRPTVRDIRIVNFDLLGQNMVANLFPVFATIGTFAEHALVSNDTHGEVIDSDTVVLATHHFWCHVAGRSRGIFCILGVPQSSNTQISHTKITLLVEHKVFWLNVSMQDCILVQVLQAQKHARDKEFYRQKVGMVRRFAETC